MNTPLLIPNEDLLRSAEDSLRRDPKHTLELLSTVVLDTTATPLDRARALLLSARASLHVGDLATGEEYAQEALDISRTNGIRRYEGLAHNEKGVFRFVNMDFDGALGHYAIAEELLKEHGTELDLNKVYLNSGNVFHRTGDEVQAIRVYETVLEIADRTGDILTEAKVSTNMSGMYGSVLFDNETAIDYSRRAIALYERLGDVVGVCKAYVNLGNQLRETGGREEAIEFYRKALDLRVDCSEPMDLFTNYRGLIVTLLQLDRNDEAKMVFQNAMLHPHALARMPGVEYLVEVEAMLLCNDEKYDKALEIINEVEAWVDDRSVDEMKYDLLSLKARCLRGLGRLEEAIDVMDGLLPRQITYTKVRANQRLVQIRQHYELVQARTAAEVERLRSVELASALSEARVLHDTNQEYLAFMAHELKSPLTSIRAIANVLMSDSKVTASERLTYCKDVYDVSTRMFDLISQVLDKRTSEPSYVQRDVDVQSIWGHVVGLWRHRVAEKNMTLNVTSLPTPIMVRGSEITLISILDNLISNAVKFSPVGSTIDVAMRTIPVNQEATRLLLSVRDQGPGLTANDLKQMFQPWTRLSAQPTSGEDSTGLGLVIVKREVDSLLGRVWCESIAGLGATFFVEIPISRIAAHGAKQLS